MNKIKRILRLAPLLLAAVLLLGCTSKKDARPDSVAFSRLLSSSATTLVDPAAVTSLFEMFSSYEFEETTQKPDIDTLLEITFYLNGNVLKAYSVDKNGVFQLDGGAKRFTLTSGEFDHAGFYETYYD